MLAAHWWNPIAWAAVRAFRDDWEFAVDATVLSGEPCAVGLGALPVSHRTARSNLKGRLLMLGHRPLPPRRAVLVATALTVLAAAALTATIPAASAVAAGGHQAVTIGVKPDGAGGYALIVAGVAVAPGAPLPGGATLPSDFVPHGGCDLAPAARARAMVIKGYGGITTYTVMRASAAPVPVHATLAGGLASLKTMRGSVARQPASAKFPEAERRHALGAIDRSIHDVETTLAAS